MLFLAECELIKVPFAKTIIAVTFVKDIFTLIAINFLQPSFDSITIIFVGSLLALVSIVPEFQQ